MAILDESGELEAPHPCEGCIRRSDVEGQTEDRGGRRTHPYED